MYVEFKYCTAQEYAGALAQGTLDAGTLYLVTTSGDLGSSSPVVRAALYIGNRKITEEIAIPVSSVATVTEAALCEHEAELNAIDIDNAGNIRCAGVDMDNLPNICGYPLYVITDRAPDRTPDFIGQFWIDINNKNAYIALGVVNSSSYVRINI